MNSNAVYLYNGVRLPKLPEWDKEAYPLCIICEGEERFVLRCYSSNKKGVLQSGVPIFIGDIRFILSDEVWVQTDYRYDGDVSIWANYDLMYWIVDDEYALYLAASDPVPLYGYMTAKMKSFVKGIILGLVGTPLPLPTPQDPYVFDPDTGYLVINRDDGSLMYNFNQQDFSLQVTEV